jgi:hypothetical protein
MGTLNAFYVRCRERSEIAGILAAFPKAKMEQGADFQGFILDPENWDVPEETLCELSNRLATDVIYLAFQSVVDAFIYFRWNSGKLVRSLTYGCQEERIWERAEGTAEPWEKQVFFKEEELQRSIEIFNQEDQMERLRRIWSENLLEPGESEPGLDSRECSREIARFYNLPGWGFES